MDTSSISQISVVERLTPNQTAALGHLLNGCSYSETAKLVGVNQSSIDNWMKLPAFKSALNESKQRSLDSATSKLCRTALRSVEVLEELMNDPETSSSTRVRACEAVLNNAVRFVELTNITFRLSMIEETLNAKENGN